GSSELPIAPTSSWKAWWVAIPLGKLRTPRAVRLVVSRAKHRERDRQVEPGAFLLQLRRGEVDRDPDARPAQLGRRDAAPHALPSLLAGPVSEPDDREAGQPLVDVRLDFDASRLEADERMRDRP